MLAIRHSADIDIEKKEDSTLEGRKGRGGPGNVYNRILRFFKHSKLPNLIFTTPLYYT